jgi:threonyl-tRNA synthetase
MERVYGTLGLKNYSYRLSLGDPGNKEKYVDNPPMWEMGESLLRRVLDRVGLEYTEAKDEAAFYGPKIDVQFQTAAGQGRDARHHPGRFPPAGNQFGLEYVGEDGERHQPIIVHRGVLSTMERMVALLIEEYEGNFPLWLVTCPGRRHPDRRPPHRIRGGSRGQLKYGETASGGRQSRRTNEREDPRRPDAEGALHARRR